MLRIVNSYITGWEPPFKESEQDKLSVIDLDNFFDAFGRSNWKWPDYPEGEQVYFPQPYTPEHLTELRHNWVNEEIRKHYSTEEEQAIRRKNMMSFTGGKGNTREFLEYNTAVEKIITESKTKDFNKEREP